MPAKRSPDARDASAPRWNIAAAASNLPPSSAMRPIATYARHSPHPDRAARNASAPACSQPVAAATSGASLLISATPAVVVAIATPSRSPSSSNSFAASRSVAAIPGRCVVHASRHPE